MAGQERIALFVWSAGHYCQNVLHGVSAFARPRKPWLFRIAPPEMAALSFIKAWRPTGIIAFLGDLRFARAVERLGLPTVDVSNACGDVKVPRVGVDDVAVGALAAEYLLNNGFRHFGYVGNPADRFSVEREQGFRDALAKAGQRCESYHERTVNLPRGTWIPKAELREWMLKRPKPSAVLCANDARGWELAELCADTGVAVPEELAVVGVDDDPLFCGLSYPPLSSVATPAFQIGYEAAALLERILAGQRPPRRPMLFPPVRVVVRRSSELIAVADSDVAQALRFIRANAHRPLGVEDLLGEVQISRRMLELKFRAALQRTPAEELQRVRLQSAKELLSTTDVPIADVALKAGFSGSKQLAESFRRVLKTTPREYRHSFRPDLKN
jgi:LacI family transcriptional regulator